MGNWIAELAAHARAGEPVALVTVAATSGSTPREVGAKMVVRAESFSGTIGGGQLERQVLEDARACLSRRESRSFRYPLGAKFGQCCGGVMDILVESLNVGPRLVLFGGGHVGQALCDVLRDTAFQVDLVEERREWAHAAELPPSVRVHDQGWEDFVDQARWDAQVSFAAVMTHRHDVDQEIVAALVRRPLRFLGLIGSRAKWQRFRQRLEARGFSAAELDRVQSPIGVPLGGKAPREVAISIAAELLRVHHGTAEAPPDGRLEDETPDP